MNNSPTGSENKIEQLASVQHDIWSHWMQYMFSECKQNEDGSYVIPAGKAQHWQRQMNTKYNDLSESEKESDREQAQKVMAVL